MCTVCTRVFVYVCMDVYVRVCTRTHVTHMCIYVCTYVHTHVWTYVYMCPYVCVEERNREKELTPVLVPLPTITLDRSLKKKLVDVKDGYRWFSTVDTSLGIVPVIRTVSGFNHPVTVSPRREVPPSQRPGRHTRSGPVSKSSRFRRD